RLRGGAWGAGRRRAGRGAPAVLLPDVGRSRQPLAGRSADAPRRSVWRGHLYRQLRVRFSASAGGQVAELAVGGRGGRGDVSPAGRAGSPWGTVADGAGADPVEPGRVTASR